MPFTGKATYSAGPDLPEVAEDVSDLIAIVSPSETPLLDHLGDPRRAATSTVHQWLEDTLLPNTDNIDDPNITDPTGQSDFDVANPSRFRVGDQVRPDGSDEILLVVDITNNTLSVVRGYGDSPTQPIADGQTLHILGNAALEGDDAPAARFTNRQRKTNYTQIFSATVQVSGTQQAVNTIGLSDELDYQKSERLRELVRDLENCVINGVASSTDPQGSSSTRRTMRGIIAHLASHVIDAGGADLTEDLLNQAMRQVWSQSAGAIDTIVVNGLQKRRINGFITAGRAYDASQTRFRDLVSVYESDFGVCRVILSRWMPPDALLLLDSSRIDVLPLAGRSFHYKPLADNGDRFSGLLVGEYTLELRNENAHGIIRNLSTS